MALQQKLCQLPEGLWSLHQALGYQAPGIRVFLLLYLHTVHGQQVSSACGSLLCDDACCHTFWGLRSPALALNCCLMC